MSGRNEASINGGEVVEQPMMKVKDIRDKYKIRDYDDYAKPKNMASKKSGNNETQAKKTANNQSKICLDDIKDSDHEVAQQVMGLFKGALDLQNDLEALEQDKMAENNFKDSTSNKSLEQKSQVISSSNGVVQNKPKANDSANSASSVLSSSPDVASDESPDVASDKSSADTPKAAADTVASFDESLDQFYDVLNNLST